MLPTNTLLTFWSKHSESPTGIQEKTRGGAMAKLKASCCIGFSKTVHCKRILPFARPAPVHFRPRRVDNRTTSPLYRLICGIATSALALLACLWPQPEDLAIANDALLDRQAPLSTRIPQVPVDADTRAHIFETYGRLPLRFEINRGQNDPAVKYIARGVLYSLSLTSAGVRWTPPSRPRTGQFKIEATVVKWIMLLRGWTPRQSHRLPPVSGRPGPDGGARCCRTGSRRQAPRGPLSGSLSR
jgi:hypothetical protein